MYILIYIIIKYSYPLKIIKIKKYLCTKIKNYIIKLHKINLIINLFPKINYNNN